MWALEEQYAETLQELCAHLLGCGVYSHACRLLIGGPTPARVGCVEEFVAHHDMPPPRLLFFVSFVPNGHSKNPDPAEFFSCLDYCASLQPAQHNPLAVHPLPQTGCVDSEKSMLPDFVCGAGWEALSWGEWGWFRNILSWWGESAGIQPACWHDPDDPPHRCYPL